MVIVSQVQVESGPGQFVMVDRDMTPPPRDTHDWYVLHCVGEGDEGAHGITWTAVDRVPWAEMVWDDTPQPLMPLTVVSGPVANGRAFGLLFGCGGLEEDGVLAEVGEGTIFVDEDVVAACAGAVVGAGCITLACAFPGTQRRA